MDERIKTTETHRQVMQVLAQALQHAPAQRSGFVARACAQDLTLQREVESLLAYCPDAGERGDSAAWNELLAPGGTCRPAMTVRTVERIGNYRLLRQIGEGGMSRVYLAVHADDRYRKPVALKLLKRGMDTDLIVRRFRYEGELLAGLNHPNIAKLLAGGTTDDGLPYFVMEYVEGLPLNEYCQTHKLDIKARLWLFAQICRAVQHAHQNLVVHRDLKPGNILITAEGVPKLLDFGIAKLLAPEAPWHSPEPTSLGLCPMTPGYASPEQACGEAVTTASDVYSLGVLLYELLTEQRPYDVKSHLPHEVARVICQAEPVPPSSVIDVQQADPGDQCKATKSPQEQAHKLKRALAGDIDAIVLKALSKEPERRYASAEQFAGDIERHLKGQPVRARKPSLGYRATRFVRRYRVAVGIALAFTLMLMVSTAFSLWQASKAQKALDQVVEVFRSYVVDANKRIEKQPGSLLARKQLLESSLDYLNRLPVEIAQDFRLMRERALAHQKLGDLLGNTEWANLADTDRAQENYLVALDIQRNLLRLDPSNIQVQTDLATTYEKLGLLLREKSGQTSQALPYLLDAFSMLKRLRLEDPKNVPLAQDLIITHNSVGYELHKNGELKEAHTHYLQALRLAEELFKIDPQNIENEMYLWMSRINLGDVLGAAHLPNLKRTAEALENYREALVSSRLWVDGSTDIRARRSLSLSYGRVGDALIAIGKVSEAQRNYREALDIAKDLAHSDPKNAQARRDLAKRYDQWGNFLLSTKKVAEAIDSYSEALTLRNELHLQDPKNAVYLHKVGLSYARLGNAYAQYATAPGSTLSVQTRRWQQARSSFDSSLKIVLDMKRRGILPAIEASQPDRIRSQLKDCETALRKLKEQSTSGSGPQSFRAPQE